MLKGALVGFAIMLAAIPIPIVHFIAIPISPFVAGFIGGGIAKADEDRIIWFGFLMAGLMLIPAAIILIVRFVFGVDEMLGLDGTVWVVLAIAIVPYTWFGVTVGALISYLIRSKQAQAEQAD